MKIGPRGFGYLTTIPACVCGLFLLLDVLSYSAWNGTNAVMWVYIGTAAFGFFGLLFEAATVCAMRPGFLRIGALAAICVVAETLVFAISLVRGGDADLMLRNPLWLCRCSIRLLSIYLGILAISSMSAAASLLLARSRKVTVA